MLQYVDLSGRHGHRDDHGFACGAEFNIKIRRRVLIPDFVRERLSEMQVDGLWWEEAERAKEELQGDLQRRYKWIGQIAFVGRGPGWLAIEDTGCRLRNWDTIGKVVAQRLKEFVASMEDADTWRDIRGIRPTSAPAPAKTPPAQLKREIEAVVGRRSSRQGRT